MMHKKKKSENRFTNEFKGFKLTCHLGSSVTVENVKSEFCSG